MVARRDSIHALSITLCNGASIHKYEAYRHMNFSLINGFDTHKIIIVIILSFEAKNQWLLLPSVIFITSLVLMFNIWLPMPSSCTGNSLWLLYVQFSFSFDTVKLRSAYRLLYNYKCADFSYFESVLDHVPWNMIKWWHWNIMDNVEGLVFFSHWSYNPKIQVEAEKNQAPLIPSLLYIRSRSLLCYET